MQLSAPAKVNLSFRIVGRRSDGFHDVETVMTPISLADELRFERGSDNRVEFECDDPSLSSGADNLVVRAARAFLDNVGSNAGVRIELEKHIPHGAGLGGGSSDAATTLLALNELFDSKVQPNELNEIAAGIGSDVPFFLLRSVAVCRGRGEIALRHTLPQQLRLLLVKPEFGVPTPEAYRRWKTSRELPEIDYDPQQFCGIEFVNDLERPVFEKYPFLARMKTWFREQPEVGAALLSGSGSTVFAALHDGADADALAYRAREQLDPKLWTSVVTTG